MSVPNTSAKSGPFPGDGVNLVFTFNFVTLNTGDVEVLIVAANGATTVAVLGTDYTITLNPDQTSAPGGLITYNPASGALPVGATLTALSNIADIQGTVLTNTGGFQPKTVEQMVDIRTIVSHQNAEALGRSIKVPATDANPVVTLPSAAVRANLVLGFDSSGNLAVVAGVGTIPIPVPLVDGGLGGSAATVAAARALIGIPANTVAQGDTAFTTTGTAPLFVLTPTPALGAYAAFDRYCLKLHQASTGADTVNISGLGTKSLKQYNGSGGKAAASFAAGTITDAIYDGVDVVLLDPLPVSATPSLIAMSNGTFAAPTFNAGTMTIPIKTLAGADPSAGDPVNFTFANDTGGYSVLSLTAARSLVVPAGASLGVGAATGARLYLTAHNDAGNLRLGIYNPLLGLTLLGILDDHLYTSTLLAAGSTTAQVLYTDTAIAAAAPTRVIGHYEGTQAVAGTYTAVSKMRLMLPGMKRTGDIVQFALSTTSASASGTTAIPNDDTIPQNTEGTQFFSQAITPQSALNLLRWKNNASYASATASAAFMVALFQDANANAIAAAVGTGGPGGGNQYNQAYLEYTMLAGTAVSTTGKIRVGNASGTTVMLNGNGSTRVMGGVLASYLLVEEITT